MLETILRLAHPLIPFVTELWQTVARSPAQGVDSLCLARYRRYGLLLRRKERSRRDRAQEGLICACRNLRGEMNISRPSALPLVASGSKRPCAGFAPYIAGLAKYLRVRVVDGSAATNSPRWPSSSASSA